MAIMITLQIVLEKLAHLLAEEAKLLGGVRAGIDELRDDLESMKAFLQDAETRIDSLDQSVKNWVNQVRDVAYDTEDVLEEFMLRIEPTQKRGGIGRAILRSHHFIKRLRARHQLGCKIEAIKSRIKSIAEKRAALSLPNYQDGAKSSEANLETWYDPRHAALYIDESDVVGIETPRDLLIDWLLTGERNLTAVSVVGMGGIGKTTLVKKVFDSNPVKNSFHCYAWITVSSTFTTLEILKNALKEFLEFARETVPQRLDTMTEFQLLCSLKNHLQEKRYIVVFDDVWSTNFWDAVKYAFPDTNQGSRIVITTRNREVAESLEVNCHIHHLQPLEEEEAWALFCAKAFRGELKGHCPEELNDMSRKILKKCGGLPLAIVVIGGLLSKKNKNFFEWKKVYDSLASEMKNHSNLLSLEKILLLSYKDLPYYLKPCFLYMSVFPEDYLIKRMKLIRLWVCERFVQDKPGLTAEQVAEDYLNELVSRCMIQVFQMDVFNKVRTCRVHDLIRDIIQNKAKEQSLVTIVDERTITGNNGKVRRLSVHDSYSFPWDIKFPNLRSLLAFLPPRSYVFSEYRDLCLSAFRLLRVLELEQLPLTEFPSELAELIHLRYLSLRRTRIEEIPECIGKLKNLEILDLKQTLVSHLPSGILKMKNLLQLRKYHLEFLPSSYFPEMYGFEVPQGIGRLTSLQKLANIEMTEDGELAKELGNLTNLRRLGILQLRYEHGRDLCYSVEKMKHLTALYVASSDSSESLQLDSLSSPPPYLQRLYLKCALETLPNWIASLQYLGKLVLQNSKLQDDPLKALQSLPSLVMLELRDAYDGEELSCDVRGYPRLKKLGFYLIHNVKRIRFEAGALPALTWLWIGDCSQLNMPPLGIQHLSNLQDFSLDMPLSFIERIERGGRDSWMVQHIPRIKRVCHDSGTWKDII